MTMNEILMPLVFFAIGVVFLSVITAFVVLVFRPWLQCALSGAPMSLPEIVGMRLRGCPVRMICEQRVKASYVGVDLSVRQLEDAHRQGADIKKMVTALCLDRLSEQKIEWGDLLRAEFGD